MSDAWPHWEDAGKRIEIQTTAGPLVGVLYYDEVESDGQDEWAIWCVRFDDGRTEEFTKLLYPQGTEERTWSFYDPKPEL